VVNRSRILGAAVAVALAAAAHAQQAGSLRGTVLDKDFESPLGGVVLTIVETSARTESTDQGTFVFPQVRPGKYTLLAQKDGYVRAVRADVVVNAGQLTELRLELAGDFTDLEEFVVSDSLQLGASNEAALLDLRLESPAMVDSIGADMMRKAGASDAVGALKLVSGASTSADGKSAVIRGLPDRYVSSQMNGILLPSADKEKRAVELDQFPAGVIESLQVSKTFTPDQQGNASGGAVNVVLKGVPDEPAFLRWQVGTTYNDQFTGRSDFLTSRGGGVHAFGKSGGERIVQTLGDNWTGSVGVDEAAAPLEYKGNVSAGGSFSLGRGWKAGGFVNAYYDRDNSYFGNGVDNSLQQLVLRSPLSPQYNQGSPASGEFYTALFDVKQGRQAAKWGGLTSFGVQNENHAINFRWLSSRVAEDIATLAEDTRGKQYYFPGHDPAVPGSPGFDDILAAPYLRLQTLNYVERATDTLQLAGKHRIALDGRRTYKAEIDWAVAKSNAHRDQPDRRQFASAWNPNGVYLQYKPAAQFTLGNLQRIFEVIDENSEEARLDVKLPFAAWAKQRGYLKVGGFHDRVKRRYDQNTFSNFSDPNFFYNGQYDQLDWSDVWGFQDHAITAADTDVDYEGQQTLRAGYAMLELPVVKGAKLVGGVRVESTSITIVNDPEANAPWVPPGQFGTATLLPGDADVAIAQQNALPAVGLEVEPVETVKFRMAYGETVGRPTFRELSPIFQQEYLGGPIFVGNPGLELSSVRNFDIRADWTPTASTLLSASWFQKDIQNPIEYVEKLAQYTFTTAVNFPRGSMRGIELEARQGLGDLWSPLQGVTLGANSTWIDASVRLPDDEILAFEQLHGERPRPTRDMTNTPEYLYNLFATYDVPYVGTGLGLFYTVTGDTLIQGTGPSSDYFVPATYQTRYETLNVTLSQPLGRGIRLMLTGRNLTNALRRQVYRSEYQDDDVTRRAYTEGVDWSLMIGGEITF